MAGKRSLRVVGGTHRGRRFEALDGQDVRPTSDRAREAAFNLLFGLGLPMDAVVVDAFAGTGALGIEALSRGARNVVFLESSPRACAVIESNLESLGLQGRVVRGDAVATIATHGVGADLVLADPPYDFDEWDRFIERCPTSVLLLESDRAVTPAPRSGFEVHRERRYGRAAITVLVPAGSGDALE